MLTAGAEAGIDCNQGTESSTSFGLQEQESSAGVHIIIITLYLQLEAPFRLEYLAIVILIPTICGFHGENCEKQSPHTGTCQQS